MEALPALARAHRYGDVRGTDTSALASVADTLVVRICAGLTPAVTGLDAEAAREMRQRMDRVHHAIGLLSADGGSAAEAAAPTDRREDWFTTLAGLLGRTDVPTEVGRPGGPGAVRRGSDRRWSATGAPGAVVRCLRR